MAEQRFRLRRKSDGYTTREVSTSEAHEIAGYPDDFEKIDEPEPNRAGYDQPGPADEELPRPSAKRKAASRRRATTPTPKAAAEKAAAKASTDAADATGGEPANKDS